MNATTRNRSWIPVAVTIVALAIGFGATQLFAVKPGSWISAFAIIASVIICSPLQISVGRSLKAPHLGVAVVILATPPGDFSPAFEVALWTAGVLLFQLIAHRDIRYAAYLTAVAGLSALAFVGVKSSLLALGVWFVPTIALATAAFYTVQLACDFARRKTIARLNEAFRSTQFSPLRFILIVFAVTVAATLLVIVNEAVIPWIERDPDVDRQTFVTLLGASIAYFIAQQKRYVESEARVGALLDAAVELPREISDGLETALQQRARKLVRANQMTFRATGPEKNEIGAVVRLTPGDEQYLIASRPPGQPRFTREDEQALSALAHVASEAARRHSEVDILERRANSDALTGLPNYGAFQKALVEANENRPYREGIALLFIDLDNFKKLNDNFGHRAGDELLRAVAQRLQEAAGGGDFVSRVGGDEFVVIFSGLVSLEQAKEASDRIIEFVSQPLALEGHDMRPMLSAGLAFSSHRELDAQTLVEDADRTMLKSKRSRRQGAPSEDSRVSISSHRSSRTNEIVARAIRDDRLMLAFQPIVNIPENRIWAHEALVRYVDPELGPISPPSLVARAKSLHLMNELTRQVITKALAAASDFNAITPGIRCITVNLELGQISDSELGPFIRESARAYPDLSLCIELNERSLRSVTDDLRRDAVALQDAGVIIALDDYGSDDSSVSALVNFPMNILKIDKSLINDLDDARQREVVKSLQGFGDSLSYTTVVEGVESAAMVEVMTQLGVQNAQGYYFGRPISRVQSADRLRKWGEQGTVA